MEVVVAVEALVSRRGCGDESGGGRGEDEDICKR